MTLTTAPDDGKIVKRDVLGRVKTSRERRIALLEEFDRSGMSGQKFAAWAGIKYTTFANWLQQRRKQRKSGIEASNGVQWVEAVVTKSCHGKEAAKGKAGGFTHHLPPDLRRRFCTQVMNVPYLIPAHFANCCPLMLTAVELRRQCLAPFP
jgi:hypothetical protein